MKNQIVTKEKNIFRLDKRIDKEISNIAIEDRFQQDINAIKTIKIKSGPLEKKEKGYDLSDKYKYQRNPLISAYALKEQIICVS